MGGEGSGYVSQGGQLSDYFDHNSTETGDSPRDSRLPGSGLQVQNMEHYKGEYEDWDQEQIDAKIKLFEHDVLDWDKGYNYRYIDPLERAEKWHKWKVGWDLPET